MQWLLNKDTKVPYLSHDQSDGTGHASQADINIWPTNYFWWDNDYWLEWFCEDNRKQKEQVEVSIALPIGYFKRKIVGYWKLLRDTCVLEVQEKN